LPGIKAIIPEPFAAVGLDHLIFNENFAVLGFRFRTVLPFVPGSKSGASMTFLR